MYDPEPHDLERPDLRPARAPLSPEPVGDELGGLPDRERLLGFYDGLRERVLAAARKRTGARGEKAADFLLVVPDVFLLLVRLVLDREVPTPARQLIGGALIYFMVPFDLMPEALIGGFGFADDLVLAAGVLHSALGAELEPFAERHWSGPPGVRKVLADAAQTAKAFAGQTVVGRVQKLLARYGAPLDEDQVARS